MTDRRHSGALAWMLRGLLIFALAMAMFACGGDDEPAAPADDAPAAEEQEDEGEEGGTITIEGQEANAHGEEDVAGASSVELEADDFYFEPTVLTGEAGQEISVHITNEGDSPHNFSLTDQDVDEDVQPGKDVEVSVTFPDSGTLVFFCSFHQSSGMLGGLEVGS